MAHYNARRVFSEKLKMKRVIPQVCSDEKYEDAKTCILAARYPCIGQIQRTLDIGYNRAERLMQALIEAGVVEDAIDVTGVIYRVKK